MKPSSLLICRLLLFCVGALLGPAVHAAAQEAEPLPGCRSPKLVTYLGGPDIDPDTKNWKIWGEVHIECDGTAIFAEELSWNDRMVYARGKLLVVQDGLRITAERMEMDRKTRLGTFFVATGTARLTDAPVSKSMFGTMEAEVWFDAERIERTGPRSYTLTKGAFSTCVQPNPRWVMGSTSATIVLDEQVVLRNVLFRVKGVPLLYVPYLYYPLKKEDRSTGFLIPSYSASDVRGQGISNALFLALSRWHDATLYHDFFSKSGQGVGADYRYVSAPGSQGNAHLYVLMEKDRLAPDGTVERAAHRSYNFNGMLNQTLGRRFQVIGSANYSSDITTQQLYQQDVQAAANRRRDLSLTLSGNVTDRLRITALVQRAEFFTGQQSSRQSSTPRVSVWLSDKPIGKSSVIFGASGGGAFVHTRPQDPAQPEKSARWFDGSATIRAPLSSLPYLTFTPTVSWRVTQWLDSVDPVTGLAVPVAVTRSLFETRLDLVGPLVSKVYLTPKNTYAEKFQHKIEPRVSVRWQSAFDRQLQLISMDQRVDGVVGGATVDYSLTNRVMAKAPSADGNGHRRQLLSVTVGQTYRTNAQTGAIDPQYQGGSAGTLSPVQLSASLRPTDLVSADFRMLFNSPEWPTRGFLAQKVYYSASTSIRVPRLQVTAGWSKSEYFTAAEGFVDLSGIHALNASTSIQTTDDRVGATYGFNFDVKNNRFLQQRIVAYLNSQCCGIAVDYQVFSVSQFQLSGVPSDRRFTITFTLAGIGSFSPPLGGFGR